MRKKIGDNSHGNKNELDFVNAFNGGLKALNTNLKEFVKYICKNENIEYESIEKIGAEYEKNTKLKQDFYIILNNKKYGISLKMGSGNSVHQEKCEDFIEYIKEEFDADDDICNIWRFFLWADGTIDGTGSKEKDLEGNIISRFTLKDFKKSFPEKREKLQKFLDNNKLKLIKHFLFEGRHNSKVDYIYHGTVIYGTWISKNRILKYQLNEFEDENKKRNNCLSIGKMSIQSWNISIKGNSEKKRGQIQVKYAKMKEELKILMDLERKNIGTYDGNFEEFNLSKIMNKNKQSKFWKKIIQTNDYEKYFVVRVTTKQISKLSKKRVHTKTDAYVIKAEISDEFLLGKEYILTEEDLKNINYIIIKGTGISIKMKEADSYTIQKFTKESFIKAFSNNKEEKELKEILFSLLIYSSEKEIYKNDKIAKDLGIDYKEFLIKMKKITGITNEKGILEHSRKNGQKTIINIIRNDKFLCDAIFTGKGWFEEPYCANFLFSHGELKENIPVEFTITTGSGRSKGIYSIEIKPK